MGKGGECIARRKRGEAVFELGRDASAEEEEEATDVACGEKDWWGGMRAREGA